MKDLKEICNVNIPNSLNSLLEASILGDIEDTLEDGDKYAKRSETFGFNYKLTNIFTASSINHDWIDTYKKITNDMYVNERLKKLCKEPWMTPQIYHLAIFIDNISRAELKMDDNTNLCHLRSNDKRVKSFGENLQKILIDNGILKSNNRDITIFITGRRRLMIHIEGEGKLDKKRGTVECIEFEYEFEE